MQKKSNKIGLFLQDLSAVKIFRIISVTHCINILIKTKRIKATILISRYLTALYTSF